MITLKDLEEFDSDREISQEEWEELHKSEQRKRLIAAMKKAGLATDQCDLDDPVYGQIMFKGEWE